MKPARDPARLSALGSAAQPELAAGIRALRAEQIDRSRVEALQARLASQLAAPTVAGTSTAVLTAGAWAKWLVSSVLLVVAAALVISRPDGANVQHARPSVASAHAPVTPAALPAEATPPQASVATESKPLVPPPRLATAVKPSVVRGARSVLPANAAPRPEAELALLQRSQTELERAPATALELAEQHARAYPHGLFAQEREILALEALLKLKQRTAAVARAERFMRDYPASPHARRVRALLERSHSMTTPTIAPSSIHSPGDPAPWVPRGGEP